MPTTMGPPESPGIPGRSGFAPTDVGGLLAFVASGAVLAAARTGTAAAETRFGLLAATVLFAAALVVGPRCSGRLPLLVGASLALWVLPPGALGATTVQLLGLGAFAAAIWERWRRAEVWSPLALAAVALGLEALFRPGSLLALVHDGVSGGLVLWPVALMAAAAIAIERFVSAEAALLTLTSTAVLGPGFDPTVALLVAGLTGALVVATLDLPIGARGVGAGVALSPALVDPRLAIVSVAAGVLFALPRWPAFTLAAALATGAALMGHEPIASLAALWPLVVVLPPLMVPGGLGIRRALGVGAVAFSAALLSTPPVGAVVGAVLAVALVSRDSPRQWGTWVLAVTAVAAPFSMYPWLRDEPVASAVAALGVPAGWPAALGVVGLLAIAVRLSAHHRRHLVTLAIVLGWWLRFGLGAEGDHRVWLDTTATLDRESPRVEIETEGAVVDRLVLDSTTANAAGLPTGTVVATVRIQKTDGAVARWPLRAGVESGEWAARRPDLALTLPASAWKAWVPEAGGFFGQRYRARWQPDGAVAADTISIERSPDLPDGVVVVITRVETRG